MADIKVLLIGATGYIGGAILTQLLQSKIANIKRIQLTVLIRKETQAALLRQHGVEAIIFSGLEDLSLLERVASEHDMVVNTASTFHTASDKAMIKGLGERKKQTKQPVHFIHTSGTESVADLPISKTYVDNRKHSDEDHIYSYLKKREEVGPSPQRTTDVQVIETGLQEDVKTYILMSPTIFGLGTGLFNKLSIQVPFFIRGAIEAKHAQVIAEGSSVWSDIHIDDLTNMYELLISQILSGEAIQSGTQGIYFTETGEHSWLEVSKAVAKAGRELGILDTEEIQRLSLEEAADKWVDGNQVFTELGFASNSRTKSDRFKRLGWTPKVDLGDIQTACLNEFKAVLAETTKSGALLDKATIAKKQSEA